MWWSESPEPRAPPSASEFLERLAKIDAVETHLVISDAAENTFAYEVGSDAISRASELADTVDLIDALGSSIASAQSPFPDASA